MNKNKFPLILLIILLAGAAVLAYFLLMKPAEKTKGTETLEVERVTYSAPAQEDIELGENYPFDDGLGKPDSVRQFELDEFGTGIASIEVFIQDINNDSTMDKITRTRFENGTAHFYYDYKIELNLDGELTDITPNGFRTVEGADCSLQKLRFTFRPSFQVVKIGREWEDSWITPTVATKTVYNLEGDSLRIARTQALKKICDVRELF
ncbi:MAG: hypothetical protein FWF97_04780 [Alphaproteobacteria bacterium]|nr:hypothetical protein [Alphaproteobacteria bacterium]